MKKFFSVLAVLLLTCFIFVGCSRTPVPASSSPALGNGGLAVQKGEYIYFVNGFVSKSENLNGNKDGKITKSGIYRVKASDVSYYVDGSGNLVYSQGNLSVDQNGVVTGAELIVSKVCGFEDSALYIYGEYIYYVTPNNGVDGSGNPYVNDLDFCRARLDGEKNIVLGTVSLGEDEAFNNKEFGFYNLDGSVYFAIYNGKDAVNIYQITKNGSNNVFSKSGVTSASLPSEIKNYSNQKLTNLEKTLYYVCGNKICAVGLNGVGDGLLASFTSDVTLLDNSGSAIYYSVKSGDNAKLYSNACTSNDFISASKLVVDGYENFTSLLTFKNRDEVVASTSTGIYFIDNGEIVIDKTIIGESVELVATSGDNLIYKDGKALYVVNFFGDSVSVKLSGEKELISEGINSYASVDGSYVYFFVKCDEGTYLQRASYLKFTNGEPSYSCLMAKF